MKLADLLKKKAAQAISVEASATVARAIDIMHQNRVGSVIVPDPDGRTVGILTERDIVRLYAQRRADFETLTVRDCMTTNLHVGDPDETVDDAMAVMTQKRFRHIPVVHEGRTLGVVSIGDVVKAKLEEVEDEAETLREYIHS